MSFEFSPHKLVYGGDALGHAQGRAVLVPRALPGEQLEVEEVRTAKGVVHARPLRVLTASPERVEPPCPYFGRCGGCQYQHLSPERQTGAKREILRETLRRIGKIVWEGEIPVHVAHPWNYRNEAQIKVATQPDGHMALGFFEAGSHRLIPVDACLIGNAIAKAGNGGIQIWQSEKRDDGTLVVDNRIEDTAARGGGSGQNGNAINVFRAGNVVVRGNRIRNAAFSAVRGNAASNIVIAGNSCSGLGEVAIYAEFDFAGAVIANNTVDGAAFGVSVTNFKQGGRLALVQGNLIRNLTRSRPAGTDPNDSFGVGIGVEADTAVTGNVIENAPNAGIAIGWGEYQRDVSVTDNIVRQCGYGITVSVAPGAGAALIANNLITGAGRGAIVGMDQKKAATGDLVRGDSSQYPQLAIRGNLAR